MAQNRSSAVMQQRVEPKDSLDYFPTPQWATRALCEQLRAMGEDLESLTCLEPACGEGHMAAALGEVFGTVHASDVHDYGIGTVRDFLTRYEDDEAFDWIITNPPFRLAREFAEQAFRRSRRGVALFVRTSFLEGTARYRDLFALRAPSHVLQFTERVPLYKGRLVRNGSSATSYCWILWRRGSTVTELRWIPPCRKRLERASDYE